MDNWENFTATLISGHAKNNTLKMEIASVNKRDSELRKSSAVFRATSSSTLHEINRREQANSVMKATSAKNRHQLNQLAQELAASRSKSADLRQTKTSVLSGIRQAKEDFLGFSLTSLLSSVELLGSMRLSSPRISSKRIDRLNSTPTNPPSGGGNGDTPHPNHDDAIAASPNA